MYKFKAEAAEMSIFGEIDAYWGDNMRYIDYDLKEAKDVKILVNSGGGQVTEGFAIADRLRLHAKDNAVEVVVCGLCASIATMVHAAGTKGLRKMTANSFYMIHNTAVWAEGGSKDLRSLADTLDTMTERIADNYVDVIESNGKLINGSREETYEQVAKWMDKETWFTAQKALEVGLIDAIEEAQTYITPDTAPAIKNQIRNCVNVPNDLMAELNNNITAEEKTFLQKYAEKFMAFCGFAPKAEEEKPIDSKIENSNEMTNEEMIEKLKAAGYTVEVEEKETEKEEEMTEEEMVEALSAAGMKVKKEEAAAENKVEAKIKALEEELARVKQGEKKPKVTAEVTQDKNLSRKERALKAYVAANEKELIGTAKALQKKLAE
jgi:ATP-dependent protease ClpP protease subunit